MRRCLHKTGLWTSLESIFLICDRCGKVWPTVGEAIPGIMVLGAVTKAKQ